MNLVNKFIVGVKALHQLGFTQIWNYAKYQIGLRNGFYRFKTPPSSINKLLPDFVFAPNWFFQIPKKGIFEKLGGDYIEKAISIGEHISDGSIKLFGGKFESLKFKIDFPIAHWTHHETRKIRVPVEDIKIIWEPARFGWAIELGKAYFFSEDEKFVEAYSDYLKDFNSGNPLNIGPNWQSAQEVALRLVALVISAHFFRKSERIKKEFIKALSMSIADHAERILPTLSYAKAQNNNHLLSEAVGLYTAGIFLQDHPRAEKWKTTGRELFRKAIHKQIDDSGEYCQHSTNYQRMMLVLALWMRYLLETECKDLEQLEYEMLQKAVGWLIGQYDEISGMAANLGHNDGSYILPLSSSDYSDYRPILQAASAAFSHQKALADGPWNDLLIWMNFPDVKEMESLIDLKSFWPATRIGTRSSWANLRAVNYHNRPAHADQLHVDLWFNGINIIRDAGTYLYNAAPPWENALDSTIVHNTIFIDGLNQMKRAGRFLWLEWAQATILESSDDHVIAEHNGYRTSGITHQRELRRLSDQDWEVIDHLLPSKPNNKVHKIFIHWLLPDWKYTTTNEQFIIEAPFGRVKLEANGVRMDRSPELNLIRVGEPLIGDFKSPNLGWYSPSYNEKVPALSLLYAFNTEIPIISKICISIEIE